MQSHPHQSDGSPPSPDNELGALAAPVANRDATPDVGAATIAQQQRDAVRLGRLAELLHPDRVDEYRRA